MDEKTASNGNNNNYDGTYGSSFPTWWSGTCTDTTATTTSNSDTLTFTASTDGICDGLYSGSILSLTTNTTWDFHKNYDMWPRGVQDPSTEFKYIPKWHILLGYKAQIHTMWE